ncbi:class I SAM-dependent rRNA methyltransferase [Caniella muris]|uniref:class I SAM-dependent rRNA methyltransferase n=1 Tax=Caniella muris TaxID=2941502 RepID=UPI00203ECBBE|nr:class I SAM-dependent rRNA methyltransferase [Caniella muris]
MKQLRPYPQAVVTKKAARAISAGHPWVFEGEVRSLEPSPATGEAATNGCVVDVREEKGTYLGTGLLSEQSKIRVRLVTRNANDRVDDAFWRRKAAWAWDYRECVMGARALPGCEPDTNCCRVVFSEADGFPGLTVDRYEDVLVSQVGTVGMERLRPTVYPALLDTLRGRGQAIRGIYERNDVASRAKEGLPSYTGWWPEPGADDPGEPSVVARENGVAYALDLVHSQKTGFFLDQKYNRRAVRDIARARRVLDCFSHVGPFGLNAAAGGAAFVRCVDISQTACDLAAANARLNGLEDVMGFTCANVFEYLDALIADKRRRTEEGGPFDLIVLDPPAFTKSRRNVSAAARGYREINNQALRLLPRGGYLATCSCSHFMDADRLKAAVAQAAHDANVQLRQVEERQQAPDHPIVWGIPETHYLDFLIFQVV